MAIYQLHIYIYNIIDALLTSSIQNSSGKCFAYFNKMEFD